MNLFAKRLLLVAFSTSLKTTAVIAADVKSTGSKPFPAAKHAAIERAVDQSFAETKAPGVIVGIWIPGEGALVTTRGLGDPATRRPMRAGDHFRIGSITKTFTATVLLQLADEKKVQLDDPVAKYLPFVLNGENITLRMLANMTSGLFNYTQDNAWVNTIFAEPKRVWTPRELVDVAFKHPPDFAPGTGWHYSNTNYVLLGMLIEQVTGKPIPAVFAERIIKPLGLKQTSWAKGGAMPAPYAHGFTVQTLNGKRADATFRDPSWAFTASELISTMVDLRTWIGSYGTGSLISPAMQRERLTWVTFPPNTPERHYGLGIGEDHGWLGHTGELPGYNTGAYYLPANKAVIVVMVNSDIPVGKINPMPLIFKALTKVVTPGNVPQ